MGSSITAQESYMSRHSTKGTSISFLWISSIVLLALVTLFTITLRMQPIAAAVTPILPAAATQVKSTPVAAVTVQESAPVADKAPIAQVEDCTPAKTPAQPAAIDLSKAPQGLTQVIDTPAYYQVFGNTAAQIRTQLQSCAPLSNNGERFAGLASYTLTWQYTLNNAGNGLCTAMNVKVGLHSSMSLPVWSASPQATEGLAAKWQRFISNLQLHENGHVALDSQYANQLLTDLQNYPATTCTTIATDIQATARATLDSLNASNVDYDHHTDHGATQGVLLP